MLTRTTSQHQTERFIVRLRLKPEIKQLGYGLLLQYRPGNGAGKVINKPRVQVATSKETSAPTEIESTIHLEQPGIAVPISTRLRVSVGSVVRKKREPLVGERRITKKPRSVAGQITGDDLNCFPSFAESDQPNKCCAE